MEEATRQNLIMAFNNVLRTSALAGMVDAQRAALAFGTTIEETEEGVIHLGPLHDFLLQQGGPELAVVEVILFMKSREARFGVRMKIPEKLESLTQEQVDTIVLNFVARGANSGTVAGQPTGPRPDAPSTSSASSTSSPSYSPPEQGAPSRSPGSDERARLKRLAAVAGILALATVGSVVWNVLMRPPPPTPLTFNDPAGLPCGNALGASDVVVCRVPRAFFEKEPREALDARTQVTKAAAVAKGYKRILVFTAEDNKLQKAITW